VQKWVTVESAQESQAYIDRMIKEMKEDERKAQKAEAKLIKHQ
jgi:hypothetical protein